MQRQIVYPYLDLQNHIASENGFTSSDSDDFALTLFQNARRQLTTSMKRTVKHSQSLHHYMLSVCRWVDVSSSALQSSTSSIINKMQTLLNVSQPTHADRHPFPVCSAYINIQNIQFYRIVSYRFTIKPIHLSWHIFTCVFFLKPASTAWI